MGRVCFVPNCTSGYRSNKEKISLFSVPKDEVMLQKWQQVISRKDKLLTDKDFVCAKHFNSTEIITEWSDGINTVSWRYPKLLEGAVPSIFLNSPKYQSKSSNKRKILNSNYLGLELEEQMQPTTYSLETDKIVKTETIFLEEVITDEFKDTIFETLWNRTNLPNEFWSMNKVINKEKYIIYTKYIIKNEIPAAEKQVMVKSDLEIKFFILRRSMKTETYSNISTAEELEAIIKIFDLFNNICKGGPSLDEFPKTQFLSNKYNENCIDSYQNIWRHSNCTIIVDEHKTKCQSCILLDRSLKGREKRISERNSCNKMSTVPSTT